MRIVESCPKKNGNLDSKNNHDPSHGRELLLFPVLRRRLLLDRFDNAPLEIFYKRGTGNKTDQERSNGRRTCPEREKLDNAEPRRIENVVDVFQQIIKHSCLFATVLIVRDTERRQLLQASFRENP